MKLTRILIFSDNILSFISCLLHDCYEKFSLGTNLEISSNVNKFDIYITLFSRMNENYLSIMLHHFADCTGRAGA